MKKSLSIFSQSASIVFINVKLTLRKLAKLGLVCCCFAPLVFSNAGCAGVMMRQIGLGGTYSEISKAAVPVSSGKGRVFVYIVPSGVSALNTAGIIEYATIDGRVYEVKGASFFYVDLAKGKHTITAEGVAGGFSYRLGKNALEFELEDKEVTFIRLDATDNALVRTNTYHPKIVSKETAERELSALNLDEYYNTKAVAEQR